MLLYDPAGRVHLRHAEHNLATRQRHRLAFLIGASRIENGKVAVLIHWCKFGCHLRREDACQEVCDHLDLCILDVAVLTTAINLLINLYRPTGYGHAGTRLGILPRAFRDIVNPKEDIGGALCDAELYGVGSEVLYQKRRQKRYRLTDGWLRDEHTPLRQACGTSPLAPAVRVLGKFFHNSAFGASPRGVLTFVDSQTNPVLKAINRYSRFATPKNE